MKEMISEKHCLYCDDEINSESETVFCDDNCLKAYIHDQQDLEKFLHENAQNELD